MQVNQLIEEMPYEELLGWMSYFEMRPVDWRDDDRTYKLLQVQGVKEKAVNIFPSLRAIYNPPMKEEVKSGQLDMRNFKGSAMFKKVLMAKGGEHIW